MQRRTAIDTSLQIMLLKIFSMHIWCALGGQSRSACGPSFASLLYYIDRIGPYVRRKFVFIWTQTGRQTAIKRVSVHDAARSSQRFSHCVRSGRQKGMSLCRAYCICICACGCCCASCTANSGRISATELHLLPVTSQEVAT